MKDSAYNEYWETDEFEDLVTRSLIGLYETKIKKEKRAPKCLRFNEKVFQRYKNVGCYFTPHDRLCTVDYEKNSNKLAFTQQIDILNDGLPNNAVMTTIPQSEHLKTSYLWSFFLERLNFLPKPFKSEIKGTYYRMTQIDFQNKGVEGYTTAIVISNEGYLQSCYIEDQYRDPISGRMIQYKNRPMLGDPKYTYKDYHSAWGTFTLQFYQDRRYLWNVQAYEDNAKATFGVYPEQIKSLFYARDLPLTGTGRKRPILHWVQAHQRRMKSGTEVDIEKYLRGTHEFVMHDTKFRITNPLKGSLK